MNRRDAIRLGAAATATILAGDVALAKGKPQKVLIFGGTGFIGPHFVNRLRSDGHTITLFNRGKRNPTLFTDIETLNGDRNGEVDAIKGRDWDVVIDDSGYLPKNVRLTADLLKDHVQHYIFVSSISAYADLSKPNADEDSKLAVLKNPDSENINEDYGALKAVCEQIVETTYGKRCAVIRPTYIVGPGDTTDRFTYWPIRVSRGGAMLAPGAAKDPIQFIDVRDLADFMGSCVEQHLPGRYNLCNEPRAVTIGQLLDTSKRLTKADTTFVWASTDFLDKHKLVESGEIPIWAPPVGEYAGFSLVSPARAVKRGLKFRPLDTTVADTIEWYNKRPADQRAKMRAGLTPEKEAELLKQLKA